MASKGIPIILHFNGKEIKLGYYKGLLTSRKSGEITLIKKIFSFSSIRWYYNREIIEVFID